MYPLRFPQRTTSLTFISELIDICLSSKSSNFTKCIHALLIKVGFNRKTFLGNRCLDLYSKFGTLTEACKVFDEITKKNLVSWNVYLNVFIRDGQLDKARSLFDNLPKQDVVSWNSMISGYVKGGLVDNAVSVFRDMQWKGVRGSEFTYSIIASCVDCVCYAKEIHGAILRSGLGLEGVNVVVGNSLIDMYGKVGVLDYAFGVFYTMRKVDVESWNSLILCCCKLGCVELALEQFSLMRTAGEVPDEFTFSIVIAACSSLPSLELGGQIFAFCVKVGYFSNTIVSSAAIDLFSKCNRLEDSVKLFKEHDQWNSVLCDTMISIYSRHGLGNNALQLLISTLREGLRPSEFGLTGVLSSVPVIFVEQGTQVHSMVVKIGLESDSVLACSLVEMYTKFGLVDFAREIFNEITMKDLIHWNTLIVGMARNGGIVEAINIFQELLRGGTMPDAITLAGVLLACNYGGLVDEGIHLFSSMEDKYGIKPGVEHYACIVSLLNMVGRIKEALEIIETMPCEPSSEIWETILGTTENYKDLNLIESIFTKLIELNPHSSVPYVALVHAYEMRGRWESMARIKKSMKDKGVKKMVGCSWLRVKSHVVSFREDDLKYHGGEDIYFTLRLLCWEIGLKIIPAGER